MKKRRNPTLATFETKLTPRQRVKVVVVAALLMLALALGVATTAQRVDAKTVCYLDPGRGRVCQVVP